MDGSILSVAVPAATAVSDGLSADGLKMLLQDATGVSCARQRLVFEGRELSGPGPLTALGVDVGGGASRVFLVEDPPPAAPSIQSPHVATPTTHSPEDANLHSSGSGARQRACKWAQMGHITGEQLAFVLMLEAAAADRLCDAVAGAVPLAGTNAALFASTVEALFRGSGYGQGIPPSDSLPAPCTGVTGMESVTGLSQGSASIATRNTRTSAAGAVPTISEIVVLCVDVSGSMQTPFEVDSDPRTRDRTRLEGVKQMFYGFRDQTANYTAALPTAETSGTSRGLHMLGLLSYDHRVTVHTEPTTNYAAFEEVVDDMETSGSTAIYHAIQVACDMLARAAVQHPAADLRVICLSDGQNNCHEVSAETALAALQGIDAVCDCLIVGDQADDALLRVVAATEGEYFSIGGLADAFECLESEAVISLAARRNGAPRPAAGTRKRPALATATRAQPRKGAMVVKPSPPTAGADVVTTWLSSDAYLAGGKARGRAGQQRRIMLDVHSLQARCAATADRTFLKVFVGMTAAGDVHQLKLLLVMRALHYRGHVCEVHITFPPSYPFAAPR